MHFSFRQTLTNQGLNAVSFPCNSIEENQPQARINPDSIREPGQRASPKKINFISWLCFYSGIAWKSAVFLERLIRKVILKSVWDCKYV
jgi:hypothetical protein